MSDAVQISDEGELVHHDWTLGASANELKAPVKSAQRLAVEIEDWILETRLEPGNFLGSEPELIDRFGVSRAVFREAIRIVEFDGLAMMKRGPSGGLFSASPDGDAVTHALSVCLRYLQTDVADIYEARLTVETTCASQAAERINERGRELLQSILDEEQAAVDGTNRAAFPNCVREFHTAVADMSRNHFHSLVVRSLFELTEQLSPWPFDEQRVESMSETIARTSRSPKQLSLATRRSPTCECVVTRSRATRTTNRLDLIPRVPSPSLKRQLAR